MIKEKTNIQKFGRIQLKIHRINPRKSTTITKNQKNAKTLYRFGINFKG